MRHARSNSFPRTLPRRFGKFLLSTSASIKISLIGVPNLGRDFYVLACREWIGFANRPVLIPRHGHHHACPQSERGSIGKLVGDVVHFSHGICGLWDAAQKFRMLYVGVVKNLEMIDAVVRLAGVAGWLARVIVGPTYGYSRSQGAAVREAGLLPAEVRQRLLTGFFSCSRAPQSRPIIS